VLNAASGEREHNEDEDRALTGTWVMDEVRLAVEKCYKIREIYEIYEYRVTQFNPKPGEGGLFMDYINKFLKLKAEASGYPCWVRRPADEERYIELFWKSEGIRLEKESIKSNAASRDLAKLCLNSMWGKLSVRKDRAQT